ncbi:hypothetical protein ACWOA0_05935 [Ignavigranum ruoffiae]|nr:hypothetical protein [Ignavigranum ruoffiae]
MNKIKEDNIVKLLEKVIENIPELITAIVAYLTYKELKNKNDRTDK